MDLDDINPAGLIFGIIGGLLGVFIANSMMPGNILMQILVFGCTAVAAYFVSNGILES